MFRLCEKWGARFPHPDYLYAYLSAEQLDDWQHYSDVHRFRDDIHWGMLFSLLININRAPNSRPTRPEEVMPYHVRKPISADTLRARIKGTLDAAKNEGSPSK